MNTSSRYWRHETLAPYQGRINPSSRRAPPQTRPFHREESAPSGSDRTTTGNHHPTTGDHHKEPSSEYKLSLVSTQDHQDDGSQGRNNRPSAGENRIDPPPKEVTHRQMGESSVPPTSGHRRRSGTRAIPSSHHRSGSRGERPNHPTKRRSDKSQTPNAKPHRRCPFTRKGYPLDADE